MTYMEKDLRNDWLDALALVKQTLQGVDLKALYTRTDLRLTDSAGWRVVDTILRGSATTRECVMWVHGAIGTFYKVERVEMLLYVAARSWAWLHYADKRDYGPDLVALCKRAGCAPMNYPLPMQRWLLLGVFAESIESLPVVQAHEDRPRCGICSIRVCSGNRRHNAHDCCVAYAVQHIYPDLKERRAAAQRLAAEASGFDHE